MTTFKNVRLNPSEIKIIYRQRFVCERMKMLTSIVETFNLKR